MNNGVVVLIACVGILLASLGVAIASNPETGFIVAGVLLICVAAMSYEHINKTGDEDDEEDSV